MTTASLPLWPGLKTWLRRALRPREQAALQPSGSNALKDRALDRLMPMMLSNAPHPYQASLLLYLMDEQRRRERRPQD